VDPVPDPLLLRKSGSAGDRTRDLCICSQKLWPLDHRGGHFLHKTSAIIYKRIKKKVLHYVNLTSTNIIYQQVSRSRWPSSAVWCAFFGSPNTGIAGYRGINIGFTCPGGDLAYHPNSPIACQNKNWENLCTWTARLKPCCSSTYYFHSTDEGGGQLGKLLKLHYKTNLYNSHAWGGGSFLLSWFLIPVHSNALYPFDKYRLLTKSFKTTPTASLV